jgi:hypothetical protein
MDVVAGEAALLGENTYNFGELVRATLITHPSAAWADLHPRSVCSSSTRSSRL